MNKKTYLITVICGLLLFVAANILLFIMSIVAATEQPFGYWWVGIVVAVVMTVCSWWLSRWLKPATTKQALAHGVIWAIEIALLLLLITIPNETFSIVFGNWSTYLIFIGVAVGPVLGKQKNS